MRGDAISFTVALMRLHIAAVCAVALGIVAMPAAAEASESRRQPDRTAVVHTDNGWVRGRVAGDHVTFAGVLRGYWSAFAHHGDPTGGGRPPWPSFSRTGSVLGLEARRIAPTPFAATHQCDFWQDRP